MSDADTLWTRVDAGSFHSFHQDWTIEIRRALNRGILPSDHMAMVDLKVGGTEPDVAETDETAYTRKANRIVIKHRRGELVAAIEVVSPGNKNNKNGLASFVAKMVDFLRNEINVVVARLDGYGRWLEYLPLTTAAMHLAAELWAQARNAGQQTAHDHALDGDVILAAQAIALGVPAIIATGNPAHIARFTPAELWQNIRP